MTLEGFRQVDQSSDWLNLFQQLGQLRHEGAQNLLVLPEDPGVAMQTGMTKLDPFAFYYSLCIAH